MSNLPATETIPLELDADGVVRVSRTRVTLDTLIAVFSEGATAEEIAQQYPSVPLADVYSVLGFYLRRPSEIQSYLDRRRTAAERVWLENESRSDPAGVRERLKARIESGRLWRMVALAADENFNNDILRGLLRRKPDLDMLRVQHAGLSGPTIDLFPTMPMKAVDYVSLPWAEVLDEADAIAADANTLFGHVNAQQINWKPSADRWSVAQCLEHLIAINREYYPQFDQMIKGEKKTTLWQRMPVLPSLFGRMMVKALSPNSNQKLKAPEIKSRQPARLIRES